MAAIDILKAFSEEPPPFDYVIPGMLLGSVGFMLSPGGTGKSMWTLQAACAIASGTKQGDLLGLQPKHGSVIYFSAEDGEQALWHRLHSMGKRFDAETRQRIVENLTVVDVVGRRPDIMNPRWHDAVIKYGTGRRLIILDTLTRFHTLDENSNSEMARLVGLLEYIAKETGASVLVIHHSSKAMAIMGRGDEQQSGRGASALVDNARWAGNLMGMSKEEAKVLANAEGGEAIEDERGFYVRFAISKQNHGAPFPECWFVRSDGGVLVRTALYAVDKRKGGKRDAL